MRTNKMLCEANMIEFGNKDKFSFIVDSEYSSGLCQIDIWVDGHLLTPVDNMAYLPQFIASLHRELQILSSSVVPPDYIFLNLGPTTDDFSAKIMCSNGHAKISIMLYENVIRVIRIQIGVSELVKIYEQTFEYLQKIA